MSNFDSLVTEFALEYSQRVKEIVNRSNSHFTPQQLEKLKTIRYYLNLLFEVRDNLHQSELELASLY